MYIGCPVVGVPQTATEITTDRLVAFKQQT